MAENKKQELDAVRDRRTASERAEPQTKVTLRRARTFRGRAYGPGRDISIPTRIAKSFGLVDEGKKGSGKK